MGSELQVFPDAATAANAVAHCFRGAQGAAISRHSSFFAAFSGGSTPKILFEALASEPFHSSIAWPAVELFFVDERVVSPESPENNFRLLRETLLPSSRISAENVHRWRTELGSTRALEDYENALSVVPRRGNSAGPPCFDLIVLGLGTDGHTASLFPGTAALAEASRPVAAGVAPQEPRQRLTLTLPVLNSAFEVVFLATGESKAPVLRRILKGEDPDLPAARVRPSYRPARWFVDRAAASLLSPG
jgi:6-phosphogluconolactonase